jgi:hypothetical protein
MAFTSTITQRAAAFMNGKLVSWGTWDADGTTGGDIDTGLTMCDMIVCQPSGSAAAVVHISVNETLPVAGSAVTIDIGSSVDVDGYWWAFGR